MRVFGSLRFKTKRNISNCLEIRNFEVIGEDTFVSTFEKDVWVTIGPAFNAMSGQIIKEGGGELAEINGFEQTDIKFFYKDCQYISEKEQKK